MAIDRLAQSTDRVAPGIDRIVLATGTLAAESNTIALAIDRVARVTDRVSHEADRVAVGVDTIFSATGARVADTEMRAQPTGYVVRGIDDGTSKTSATNPAIGRVAEVADRGELRACLDAAAVRVSSRVSSRLKIVVILVAWLLTTGAQWDVVQTVGWVRMMARYADTMSFAQAVKKTFNAEICGICEAVDDARQHHERALPGDLAKAKCVLVCQSVPVWVFAMPEANRWLLSDSEFVSSLRPVPPTPPPRAA